VPLPPLLSSRPPAIQIVVANVVPCLFGAITGVMIGGLQFGAFILVVDALSGLDREAHLPEPAIILVVATTVIGAVLGFFGGLTRERRMRRAAAIPPA
jgi:hypothetical protein